MKKIRISSLIACHVLASTLVLTACGSGGGGGGTAASTALEGLVAIGAPVPNAEVTVKDSAGLTSPVKTADEQGVYSFTVDELKGLTAPLLVQAKGVVGGTAVTLHSLLESVPSANNQQVLNVTPATEAITAQTLQADPATLFKDKAPATVDTAQLTTVKERLRTALAVVLQELGVDAQKVDLMTTKFTADNTGLDKLFDLVSIRTNATGGTQRDVVVAEKKEGGSSVTVTADSSSVTVLPKPGNEAKLTISTIKDFIAIFNRLVMSKAGIESDEMKDLFDPTFLDSGMDRSALITDLLENALGRIQLSNLLINGCNSNTDGDICKGQFTVTDTNTKEVDTMPMTFKLGATDQKWRAYGNRAPFDFELKPVAFQSNVYSSPTSSPSTTVYTGINFWFTGRVKVNGSETPVYKSAKLWSSINNGDNWTLVMTLKTPQSNTACSSGTNFLPIDGGSVNDCTNFKVISDASIIDSGNIAQASGVKKFKIEAFTSVDASGEVAASHIGYSKKPLFTNATAVQAMLDVPTSITAGNLGTVGVQFSSGGALLDSVSIGVYNNSVGSSNKQSNTNWNGSREVNALLGNASVAAAKNLCLGSAPSDSCEASYGASAVVKRIHLSARDAQGRGVWKSYNLSGF